MASKTQRLAFMLLLSSAVVVITIIYTRQDDSRYNQMKIAYSDITNLKLFKQKYGHLLTPPNNTKDPDMNYRQVSGLDTKTKVYRHNGEVLERLFDFCTWPLPMDSVNLKTPKGSMTIYIHDVEDDPGLSGILKKTGIRDPENAEILINELKRYPNAGFFDFGSHIGVYCLSIAHTLGRRAVCIDPMVENMVRLCRSVQKNGLTGNVTLVYNPISNENTKVSFKREYKHIGATSVIKGSDGNETSSDDSKSFSVMLDDIIPIVPFKTAVMKLDVEKSEYFAIQGGQKFLEAIDVRSILMEWYNIVQTEHAGPLVELMKKLNYVPHVPDPKGNHLRVNYEDYKTWRKHRFLLDILWIKQFNYF